MRLCVDCKHAILPHGLQAGSPRCGLGEPVELVYGRRPNCADVRQDPTACGPKGKWWRECPPIPAKPWSFTDFMTGWL